MSWKKDYFSCEDILKIARLYDVDQSDMLETFLCELLNISEDELYEQLAEAR